MVIQVISTTYLHQVLGDIHSRNNKTYNNYHDTIIDNDKLVGLSTSRDDGMAGGKKYYFKRYSD